MPPDLSDVFKKIKDQLRKLFLRRSQSPLFYGRPSSPSSSSPPAGSFFSMKTLGIWVIAGVAVIWFFSGLFIVAPAEKAVILRFGKYFETREPGLHWLPKGIDKGLVLNVQQVKIYPYQSEMLTQDENIVSVDLAVQYRISNLQDYLFNVQKPDESLQQATASALRQVIGQTTLDDVLTSGREKVRQATQDTLEKILSRYRSGLIVTDVTMQPVKPPEALTAAFDDAIKAREDEQRFKNQAVTYANRSIPIATGQASRLIAEAQAYQKQVVLSAQGTTAPFLALLPQYQAAPDVTRQRMYFETLQRVLGHAPKIMAPEHALIYLPIDALKKTTLAKENNPQKGEGGTLLPSSQLSEKPAFLPLKAPALTNNNEALLPYPARPSYDEGQSPGGTS